MEKPFLNLLLSSIFVQIDGLDGLSATQILECTEEQGGLVLHAWMAPEVNE